MTLIMRWLLVFLFVSTVYSACYAQEEMTLKYDRPAADWNEALPIGNGRLGAMIYGVPEAEQIQLNEETIWAGEPGNNVINGANDNIEKIRELLNKGAYQEAQELSNVTFPRNASDTLNYGMPYQSFGSLWIDFPGHEKYSELHRELNIAEAVARTSYTVNGIEFNREIISSFTDDVVILKLTASKENALSFSLRLTSPYDDYTVKSDNHTLRLAGVTSSVDNKVGGVRFEGIVKPIVDGGEIKNEDGFLKIKNANEVLIYVSIGTNFNNYKDLSGDPFERASKTLETATNKSYKEALKNHIDKYQSFFNRVSLDLGTSEQANKMTNIRVKEFSTQHDPELVSLYFQFGRYLLISSSQPGGQPANLQGIWNDKLFPPWDSKYTVNINTEMNYWPAEVTNLSEMHYPLFSMVKDLSITGRESAKEMYRARGWNMHHNTDLWRITGVVDGGYYGVWPMGGAWLSQHLWQHYLYNGNIDFLNSYYEVLKGKALFYLDVLRPDPSGRWLVVSPSISPENSYLPGSIGVSAGTTMDNQLVFDVFNNFIDAAEELNIDHALADSIRTALEKLPPMQVGKFGQLQEWLSDWDDPKDKHRHISHLYGLYPSSQISPFRNPELAEAAITTLKHRGDKSTGWSMGWKVNWWARLLDGNQAYNLIREQLSPPVGDTGQAGGTYPNLLDAHPPFQIDGNFGCTAGIAEMLVQSYDGNIFILPALPDAWSKGSVKGLKVQGGFELSFSWEQGRLTKLTVLSNLGGNCRLRLASDVNMIGETPLEKAAGENQNPFYRVHKIKKPVISSDLVERGSSFVLPNTKIIEFETEKGRTYIFNKI